MIRPRARASPFRSQRVSSGSRMSFNSGRTRRVSLRRFMVHPLGLADVAIAGVDGRGSGAARTAAGRAGPGGRINARFGARESCCNRDGNEGSEDIRHPHGGTSCRPLAWPHTPLSVGTKSTPSTVK